MLQVFNNYYFYIFRRRPSRNYNPNQNSYVDSEDENDPRRRRKHEYDSGDSSELCYPTSISINAEQKSSEDAKSNNDNHAPEENNNNNDDDIEEKAKKIAENEALKQARIEAKLKV